MRSPQRLNTLNESISTPSPGIWKNIIENSKNFDEFRIFEIGFEIHKKEGALPDEVPHLVAAYLCTPLVKFPVASLQAGAKVVGTTIAELGNRNRPIDMIVYKKDGQDYILMSNNVRGVMKVPTSPFAKAAPISSKVPDTGGVPFETIASMKGVQQLDLLDSSRAMLLVQSDSGLDLQSVALP